MTDLIALAVLVVAGVVGWQRGTLRMALPIAGVVAGYAGALALFRPLGAMVASASSLPPVIAYPIGGVAAFMLTSIVARFTVSRITKERLTLGGAPVPNRSRADQLGGAALGMATAVAVGLVLLWAVASVRAVSNRGPDISNSVAGQLVASASRRAVQAAAERITGEKLFSSTVALLASNPKEGSAAVQSIGDSEQLRELLADEAALAAMRRNDAAALARHPALVHLAQDDRFRDAAERLGIVPKGSDAAALAGAMVDHVAPMLRTMDELKRDPEALRLLEGDNGIAARFQSGDAAGLLADPEFNKLASRIVETMRRQRAPR